MKLLFLVLLLQISFVSQLPAMSASPRYFTTSSDYHIVKKGETLESISKKYSLPVQRLKLFNNLTGDKVFVGQKLYLYPKKRKKAEFVTVRSIPKSGIHIVKSQESIHRIAKMYDLSVFELLDMNDLNSYDLKAGQRLRLRQSVTLPKQKITKKIPAKPEPKPKITQKMEPEPAVALQKIDWPVTGKITSKFGIRNGRPHKGVDIAAEKGKPIHACMDGEVVYVGTQRGYGNVIILEHENFIMTVYAHNETNFVRLGEKVKRGQPIAALGQTGTASGPHLHFEYRVKGKAIDPQSKLPEL